ncbi:MULTISPECIES: class III lanthipeptide [Paenibacillus]|nr:class III lanthipeptide [Paenibacillus massiliensis]
MNDVLALQKMSAKIGDEQEVFPITITWTVTTVTVGWSTASNHC